MKILIFLQCFRGRHGYNKKVRKYILHETKCMSVIFHWKNSSTWVYTQVEEFF